MDSGKGMDLGQQQQQQHLQQQQQVQRQKASLQLAYQDALKVCHPDIKRPFSSLEDACERLLPYHVVADYEAEEDDKILDSAISATTGEGGPPTPILSRSQQWDNNIAAKVAEFTSTFEKQVLAFNIINRKREFGEFRTEEKLMVEQLLLQDERQKFLELRAQMDNKRQRVVHESTDMGEMMGRGPIRGSSSGSFGGPGGGSGGDNVFGPGLGEQDQEEFNEDDAVNGWGGDVNKDDNKEPSEDFLNDDEADNGGDSASHGGAWRGGGGGGGSGELDLNAR